MGEGKQGVVVMDVARVSKDLAGGNPIAQLQAKYKELETGFKAWLEKQSLPVEAAVITATSGLQGAAIGGLMGTLTNDVSSSLTTLPPGSGTNPDAMAALKQANVSSVLYVSCCLFCMFLVSA